MMRLYRLEHPDHPAVWVPRVRVECSAPPVQAMRMLLDGWWICAPGQDEPAEV